MARPYATNKVSLNVPSKPNSTGTTHRIDDWSHQSDQTDYTQSISSLNKSPSRFVPPCFCPFCDKKAQCGRRRCKSEGVDADPLREYNGGYESINDTKNCHIKFQSDSEQCNSRFYDTQNQTASSLPFRHHYYHNTQPRYLDIDGNMDSSKKSLSYSPVKKYRERLLPSNHLHQQRYYETGSINAAKIINLPEMNENPNYDKNWRDEWERNDTTRKQKKNTQDMSLASLDLDRAKYACDDRISQAIESRTKRFQVQDQQSRESSCRNEALDDHYIERSKRSDDHTKHSHNSSFTVQNRYQQEMKVLQSKLLEMRGTEGKRIRQCSDSDPGISLPVSSAQKCEAKRARDISPHDFEYTEYNVSSTPSNGCVVSVACCRPSGHRAQQLPSLPVSYKSNGSQHRSFRDHEDLLDIDRSSFSTDSDNDEQDSEYTEYKAELEEDSEEDNQSAKSSLTTVSSSGSSSSAVVRASMGSISLNDAASAPRVSVPLITRKLKGVPQSLRPSMFSHVPPYICFTLHDASKGDTLPVEIHRLLKWKLSTITPLVVRRTLINTGFRLVRKSNDWCGTWGKHMKSLCFKTLKDFQKINHFPGTFQIGRKDRLWKNLQRLMGKFGKKEFGFIPRTYVLPQDGKLLRQAWEKNCGKEKWIIKPPASARGTGIKVVHRWNQIPKKRPLVVQKYIARPYLINGSKFDLRLYVLVTSMNPLRAYIYEDGLVRFASVKYSEDTASLGDRFMHLTNYSINKLSSQYTANEDSTACQGHKWTVKTLWSYLKKDGVDVNALWASLVDLSIKTLISGESAINQLTRANLNSRYASYELFGIDVLLDVDLKPWLLEVNISPSLHSSSPLDMAVKGPMVRDVMNMAGYQIPSKMTRSQQESYLQAFGLRQSTGHLCFDKRLYTMVLSKEERTKHTNHQQTTTRAEYLSEILTDLTPDDVRHLIQSEDELTQAGNFTRVFPTPETHSYLEFFESPRYYNMLFDAWETKYHQNRQEGINLLEARCQNKYHLTVPVPGGAAKFFTSQLNLSVDSTGWEDNSDEKSVPDRKLSTSYRAVRPRSGKLGVIARPYTRSVYLTRKQKSSTLPTSLAKCSSLSFDTT